MTPGKPNRNFRRRLASSLEEKRNIDGVIATDGDQTVRKGCLHRSWVTSLILHRGVSFYQSLDKNIPLFVAQTAASGGLRLSFGSPNRRRPAKNRQVGATATPTLQSGVALCGRRAPKTGRAEADAPAGRPALAGASGFTPCGNETTILAAMLIAHKQASSKRRSRSPIRALTQFLSSI
jgi:hypothetical protein